MGLILENLIGEETTQALTAKIGGDRRYIPHDRNRLGWLIEIAGESAAETIWQEYRGCYLSIPKGCRSGYKNLAPELRSARDHMIYALSAYLPNPALATMFSMHRREIQRIVKRLEKSTTLDLAS